MNKNDAVQKVSTLSVSNYASMPMLAKQFTIIYQKSKYAYHESKL